MLSRRLLPLLFASFIFSGELEVEGNLNVSGTIQSQTIDSLLQVIAQLQAQIALMQDADNKLETRIYEYQFNFEGSYVEELDFLTITGHQLDFAIIKCVVSNYNTTKETNLPIGYEYSYTTWQGNQDWGGGGLLFYINGSQGSINYTDDFMTYDGENSIRLVSSQTGHTSSVTLSLIITAQFPD
jgi:uncharacterized coiled-coil protein SlyX